MLAALLLAAALAAPDGTLVRYDVVESTRALTPSGARDRALAGTILAMGGKARWDLSASRFPGVAARSAIAEGASLVLLDPDSASAVPLSRDEFDGLFLAAPGPEGASAAELSDVTAEVRPSGDESSFEGRPVTRWTVAFSFVLVSTQVGRVVRLRHEASGIVETVGPESGASRTPFDDLLRLFRARGAARDALALELAKVTGLPVRVRIEASSESVSESVGPGGAAGAKPPVRATWTTTRSVSRLERRAAKEEDAALFAVPESYRFIPLEKAKSQGVLPR
jgi:hypothetical protein